MSTGGESEQELQELLVELTQTLELLQRQLERQHRRRPFRPPRMDELVTFTSEVTIPALILLLETNLRALKLFQRTLRLVQEGQRETTDRDVRIAEVGDAALQRLSDVLADVQDAFEGQPPDEEARDLLADARDLNAEIRNRLADSRSVEAGTESSKSAVDDDSPMVDVEAELQSIRDEVDEKDDGGGDEPSE